MCRELDALRQSIQTHAGNFVSGDLLPAQAARVVHICAQMEASIASLKALAAARAADGNRWRDEGYRSPADHLAHHTGVSPATAKRTLATGKRLAQQPDVAAAALAGQLSAEQAEAVSEGVAANPAKARELIEKARHSSLPELNEEVARTKAAVADREVRRQTIHAKRSLRRWTDRDGALQAHLYGNPEDGINLWRMLDPIRRRLIILRRDSSPHQPLDALDFDALMSVAAIAGGQDGELGLADLLELGLFPQLDASMSPGRSPSSPAPSSPAPSPSPPASRTPSPRTPSPPVHSPPPPAPRTPSPPTPAPLPPPFPLTPPPAAAPPTLFSPNTGAPSPTPSTNQPDPVPPVDSPAHRTQLAVSEATPPRSGAAARSWPAVRPES